jgi:integrase
VKVAVKRYCMRPFSVYRRASGIYYAELFDERGIRIASRSTNKRKRDEAVLVAHRWTEQGLPCKAGEARALSEQATVSTIYRLARELPLEQTDAVRIVAILKSRGLVTVSAAQSRGETREEVGVFLARHWAEASPYIAERTAMGHRIGKRHAYEMSRCVNLYWKPYFAGKPVGELRRSDLKVFTISLAGRGLAAGTIAKAMQAGTTIFRWAHATEILAIDPSEGLGKFSGPAKKRGVLTVEEVRDIFALEWRDERTKVGCIIALTCGLRAGEVLGLRVEDIADAWLRIRHSWSELDRLKAPKTEAERRVPLIPTVRTLLLALVATNPYGQGPESFVFFDPRARDRPMAHHILRGGFEDTLARYALGDKYTTATRAERRASIAPWRARSVSLHSFRHLYAARLADKVLPETAMRTTGHSSRAVFDAYADHIDDAALAEVGAAIQDGLGKLLTFKATA